MKEIAKDTNLIAYCGLYCGACSKYLKEKCTGCHKNEKASWCKLRACCIEKNYESCADCKEFDDVNDCKKFNNFMAKIFAFFYRSDRKACIELIKNEGYLAYAIKMTAEKKMTIKR